MRMEQHLLQFWARTEGVNYDMLWMNGDGDL